MKTATDLFAQDFKSLTGHPPYSWQERLYTDWLRQGKLPLGVSVPTGTGKTRIMALWLLALASGAPLPRRLVWVVDRRVVVDQATREAERLRNSLDTPTLARINERLRGLSVSGTEGGMPLAISTLRGEYEDNREWCEDPSRPAIVVGTVDMVGSRLLFSGYGDGRWHRPFHAGLLAIDTLVILDEAQLSVPFESLVRTLVEMQKGTHLPLPAFRFLPISATLRSGLPFGLTPEEWKGDGPLAKILQAPKKLQWHGSMESPLPSEEFVEQVVECASSHRGEGARVVVYLDRLKDVSKVTRSLEKATPEAVAVLTGTVRGHERDRLLSDPTFGRFLLREDPGEQTVYLVSTSAGEVGIDLYSDHMVCDLVSVERMVQRLGRVNRAGIGCALVDVVVREGEAPRRALKEGREEERKARADARSAAIVRTEAYLRKLSDASPSELAKAPPPLDAYAPPPPHPPLRRWLVDAWSLTSDSHPNLPVDPWLRGTDVGPPDVYFAWREEVGVLADPSRLDDAAVEAILREYRLLPKEVLRNDLEVAIVNLVAMAKRKATSSLPLVVLSPSGDVEYRGTLFGILNEAGKGLQLRSLAFRTFLLAPGVGGLDERGMLDPEVTKAATDVSPVGPEPAPSAASSTKTGHAGPHFSRGSRNRGHLRQIEGGWEFEPMGGGETIVGSTRDDALRLAKAQLHLPRGRCFRLKNSGDQAMAQELVYLKAEREPGCQDDPVEMLLELHLNRTRERAEAIARKVNLPEELVARLGEAAGGHDLGKARAVWQEYARNKDASRPLAKSARYRGPETLGGYRHELGSLIDLEPGVAPLVRHLVATHHGYGRPYFPDRALDREHLQESRKQRTLHLREFMALERTFGWWGLAYLESLLKAADGMASP